MDSRLTISRWLLCIHILFWLSVLDWHPRILCKTLACKKCCTEELSQLSHLVKPRSRLGIYLSAHASTLCNPKACGWPWFGALQSAVYALLPGNIISNAALNLFQAPLGDAMNLFMWQDDTVGVARFIDECLHQLALPWGTRHLISWLEKLAGNHVMILLLLKHTLRPRCSEVA